MGVYVPFHPLEIFLALQVLALMLYEFGEVFDEGIAYFRSMWNLFEILGLGLATLWFFTRYSRILK